MREKYQNQLKQIKTQIIYTASLCMQSLKLATELLFTNNDELLELIIHKKSKIDNEIETIEALCIKILYRQQPVAQDLTFISNVLKLNIDLKRISSQTIELSILSEQLKTNLDGFKVDLEKMTTLCLEMLKEATDNFDKLEKSVSEEIIEKDNTLDNAYLEIKKKIKQQIMTENETPTDPIDILLIAKYLERIGDHVVNIARCEKMLI